MEEHSRLGLSIKRLGPKDHVADTVANPANPYNTPRLVKQHHTNITMSTTDFK